MTGAFAVIHGSGANTQKIQIAALYSGVNIEVKPVVMGVDNKTESFLKKFPLGKIPVLETTDGFFLNESNAICYYVANAKEHNALLGSNKKEQALVHSFVAMSDNEFNPIQISWLYPLFGYGTHSEAATTKAKADAKRALAYLNTHLATRTFLVGDRVTLADIALVSRLAGFYKHVFDASFIGEFKNVTRWFKTCVNQPHFKAILGAVEFCTKATVYDPAAAALTNAAPAKKEKAPSATPASPKKEKAAPKAAAHHEDEGEDLEAIAAAESAKPKEKNKLDLLPKSSFVLDDWKRFYSNTKDTRPTATNWFWQHFDNEGYSIYKVDYKYNKELTQVFMSSNLIGGFFQRLESARKYAFGSMLVLGTNGHNEITGYFVFRGLEIPFEVEDSPDFESFNFVKVNDQDAKVREDVNAVFAWDEKIRGKVCADGKVYK